MTKGLLRLTVLGNSPIILIFSGIQLANSLNEDKSSQNTNQVSHNAVEVQRSNLGHAKNHEDSNIQKRKSDKSSTESEENFQTNPLKKLKISPVPSCSTSPFGNSLLNSCEHELSNNSGLENSRGTIFSEHLSSEKVISKITDKFTPKESKVSPGPSNLQNSFAFNYFKRSTIVEKSSKVNDSEAIGKFANNEKKITPVPSNLSNFYAFDRPKISEGFEKFVEIDDRFLESDVKKPKPLPMPSLLKFNESSQSMKANPLKNEIKIAPRKQKKWENCDSFVKLYKYYQKTSRFPISSYSLPKIKDLSAKCPLKMTKGELKSSDSFDLLESNEKFHPHTENPRPTLDTKDSFQKGSTM